MRFNVPLPGNTGRLVKNFTIYLLEFFIIVKNLLKSLHSSNRIGQNIGMLGGAILKIAQIQPMLQYIAYCQLDALIGQSCLAQTFKQRIQNSNYAKERETR
jgi:hypothetical protein